MKSLRPITIILIKWFERPPQEQKPICIILSAGHVQFLLYQREKKEVPFTMAIGNWELMYEFFPKHSRMGTARKKEYNETGEDGKKRGVIMEKVKRARNKSRQPITT